MTFNDVIPRKNRFMTSLRFAFFVVVCEPPNAKQNEEARKRTTMMKTMLTEPSLSTAAAEAATAAETETEIAEDEYGLDAFMCEYCARRFGPGGTERDWLVLADGNDDDDDDGDDDATAAKSDSIRSFVNDLNLPRIHPWCQQPPPPPRDPATTARTTLLPPLSQSSIPSGYDAVGRRRTAAAERTILRLFPDGHRLHQTLTTFLYQSIPPRWAFAQLWVRYAGGPAALAGFLWLALFLRWPLRAPQRGRIRHKEGNRALTAEQQHEQLHDSLRHSDSFWTPWVAIGTATCSYIVMVDAMYQYEFGTRTLQVFFAAVCAIAARALGCCSGSSTCGALRTASMSRAMVHRRRQLLIGAGLAALLATSFSDTPDHHQPYYYDETEPVQIEPGLYYNHNNSLIHRAITQYWPSHKRTYTRANATAWMHTGDARTGIPYYLNSVPDLDWKSVFVTVRNESSGTDNTSTNITDNTSSNGNDEVVLELALSFPPQGHDRSKPLYLVLHGMNGGTTDGYIRDLAWRRNHAGSTVAVMVARGFMGSPLRGHELFHGARWSDVHAAAGALRKALGRNQLLVGVGYSMGAIVVANYAVKSGSDCALDAAVAISGALECRVEQNYTRAQKLWQPMVAALLRLAYFDRFLPQLASKLSESEILGYQRATHVVGLDQYASALYNGYSSLQEFYSDMGALGDIPLSEMDRPHVSSLTKPPQLVKLSTPLLVLHALDDPLSTWRTVAANRGIMHPHNLVQAADNLVMLLTERGGHVGWPMGWRPHRRGWEFMNDVAAGFAEAIAKATMEDSDDCEKDDIAAQMDDRDGDAELEDIVGVCNAAPTFPSFDSRAASTLISTES
jgi:predicted alpha/beta-fold hydrolase